MPMIRKRAAMSTRAPSEICGGPDRFPPPPFDDVLPGSAPILPHVHGGAGALRNARLLDERCSGRAFRQQETHDNARDPRAPVDDRVDVSGLLRPALSNLDDLLSAPLLQRQFTADHHGHHRSAVDMLGHTAPRGEIKHESNQIVCARLHVEGERGPGDGGRSGRTRLPDGESAKPRERGPEYQSARHRGWTVQTHFCSSPIMLYPASSTTAESDGSRGPL